MASEITLASAISTANTGLDAIKRAPIVEDNTGIKCLRIQDVSQNKSYDSWGFTKVTPENFKKFQLKKDDIMIARTGGSVGVNLFILNDAQSVFNNGLIRIRTKTEKFFPKYIYYLLQTDSFKSHIEAIAYSTSAQPNMKIRDLLRFTFIEQNLGTQEKIAYILSTLDEKIELNRQMNETLEAMAQALFKSWFVDFDPVIDNALAAGKTIPEELMERAEQRQTVLDSGKDNSSILDLFPDEFELTEDIGWIPKGWEVSNVGTEFDVTMGQSPPGSTYNEIEEGIYFFQGSTDFGFRYPTPRIYCTAPKRLANKRDTLVSVRAPVGDTNLAADDCCIGRGLAALRHKSGSASFTYYSMLQLKENFKIYEGEGTLFGSINQKDFKSLTQLRFPVALVSKFEVIAGSLDYKIELNSLNIIKLSNLRDTLLPKLLSGELRIPNAERLVDEML